MIFRYFTQLISLKLSLNVQDISSDSTVNCLEGCCVFSVGSSRAQIIFWWEYWQYHHLCTLRVNWISLSLSTVQFCLWMHTSSFWASMTTTKIPSSLWLKSDDKFCSGSPLKRLHVNLKEIAHKRNTISDQVLRQDYNSFWFKFWLYFIKTEMDKKKDKILD